MLMTLGGEGNSKSLSPLTRCDHRHKKFPGEIFNDACVGPEGVAAMDGRP